MAGPRKFSVSIDMKKLERALKKELPAVCDKTIRSVTASERKDIGEAMIEEMKIAIAKGVSPIKGTSRFAAYKWASVKNSVLKSYRGIDKSLKKGFSERKKKFEASVNTKYPFSMKKKFPQKKERPVNLELSGDFLDSLEARSTAKGLEIGFWDQLSIKKEMGHREGVNGQPKRPIIPAGNEQFSASIYRRLVEKLVQTIKRKKIRT